MSEVQSLCGSLTTHKIILSLFVNLYHNNTQVSQMLATCLQQQKYFFIVNV
jgi:hypothetical protein